MIKSRINTRLMGSDFELIVVAKDHRTAKQRLLEAVGEIGRIENLLTEFNDHSQTGLLNSNAGRAPVAVDLEVFELLRRSMHISELTQGAFDISAGVLKALYNFKGTHPGMPDTDSLAEVLKCVGYRRIGLFPGNKVSLCQAGMHISFGAIGKGYAADRVRTLWKAAGVEAGVINASGDLTAWGKQPGGDPWKIGIADPRDPSVSLMWLPVANASVATSGNYEQFFDIGGVRYSHNIDPRTGLPVRGIKSVTIIGPSAELSDALATAVTVMGKEAGLDLIDQLPDIHGILIDDQDRVHTSRKIKMHEYS